MKKSPLIKIVIQCLVLWISCISPLSAQIKGVELEVTPEACKTQKKEAKFYPLFWQAKIGGAKAFIPLDHVDMFGIQEYRLNDHFITEFTVSLKSKTFIRFYAIHAEGVGAKAEDIIRNRGRKDAYVIKEYPITTHKEMMEYRLKSKEEVQRLMKHFYKTYLDFKMKDFIKEQREKSVVKIDLEKKAYKKEDDFSRLEDADNTISE